MRRPLIASILSIALAATSFTAAPARADEDVFKVIAGLVVIGALANAANKKRDREKERARAAQVSRKAQQHTPLYQKNRRATRIDRAIDRARVAPQRCVREQWTHRGTREVYGARCMQRHARAQLPQTCLRQNQTNSGPRYFYAPRCLRQQGWRA
jgi:hypothetical protein